MNFVENEQCADFIAAAAQGFQIRRPKVHGAREPLHRLDYHCGRLVSDVYVDRVDVPARDEAHVKRGTREAIPLLHGSPRDSAGGSGAAVKTAFNRGNMRAARHAERELHRVLIGFGAGVDEEHTREVELGKADQPLSRTHANLHRNRVRLEITGFRLLGESGGPTRMRVSERGHGVASIQVEHALADAILEPNSFGRNDLERILREHRRQKIVWRGGRLCYGNCVIHSVLSQVQPGAGALRPEVSGRSNIRFIHCTAPPAAPLLRLSTTHITATVRPFATAERCA